MNRPPRYLMGQKDLAKYVSYVNNGASADSKALFLRQFKHEPLEVTCCEDCESWLLSGLCMRFDEYTNKNDFCSMATRKGGRNA